jgi:SPP1 family predicted phage head-tail adaptor
MTTFAAGNLTRRVTFQQRAPVPAGQTVRTGATWTDVLSCWARVQEQHHHTEGGDDDLNTDGVTRLRIRVTVRHRTTIDRAMRVVHHTPAGTRTLLIRDIRDPDSRQEYLVLDCVEDR